VKGVAKIVSGFVVGVVLTGFISWKMMPEILPHERLSPYGTAETIAKIKENAIQRGWVVPNIRPLHKSILKYGGGKVLPVMLVNLCQANHAFNLLKEDENKKISVYMPCTISVYEKSDGKTYISTMDVELLGKAFGGKVDKILKEVKADQQSFIDFSK
jgi:uncharacterized protein (DUF302 family)